MGGGHLIGGGGTQTAAGCGAYPPPPGVTWKNTALGRTRKFQGRGFQPKIRKVSKIWPRTPTVLPLPLSFPFKPGCAPSYRGIRNTPGTLPQHRSSVPNLLFPSSKPATIQVPQLFLRAEDTPPSLRGGGPAQQLAGTSQQPFPAPETPPPPIDRHLNCDFEMGR